MAWEGGRYCKQTVSEGEGAGIANGIAGGGGDCIRYKIPGHDMYVSQYAYTIRVSGRAGCTIVAIHVVNFNDIEYLLRVDTNNEISIFCAHARSSISFLFSKSSKIFSSLTLTLQ